MTRHDRIEIRRFAGSAGRVAPGGRLGASWFREFGRARHGGIYAVDLISRLKF
jgi:hypothetical protein